MKLVVLLCNSTVSILSPAGVGIKHYRGVFIQHTTEREGGFCVQIYIRLPCLSASRQHYSWIILGHNDAEIILQCTKGAKTCYHGYPGHVVRGSHAEALLLSNYHYPEIMTGRGVGCGVPGWLSSMLWGMVYFPVSYVTWVVQVWLCRFVYSVNVM